MPSAHGGSAPHLIFTPCKVYDLSVADLSVVYFAYGALKQVSMTWGFLKAIADPASAYLNLT